MHPTLDIHRTRSPQRALTAGSTAVPVASPQVAVVPQRVSKLRVPRASGFLHRLDLTELMVTGKGVATKKSRP